MAGERVRYWSKDFVRPVEYDAIWVDGVFGRWAKETYGSQEKFFNEMAVVVSVSPTEREAHSHPTGGRTLVHNLRRPFIDPQFRLPCFEADVKGIMLTSAGYRRDRKNLVDPRNRRELMRYQRSRDYSEVFGLESLEFAQAHRDNMALVRNLGMLTPYPLAILEPRYLFLAGQRLSISEVKHQFNLPLTERPVFFIRAYPLSSTRASDFLQRDDFSIPRDVDCPADLPDNFPLGGFGSKPISPTTEIKKGRAIWRRSERGRLIRAFGKDRFGSDFDRGYFAFICQQTAKQVAWMLKLGLSPTSGKESDDQNPNHTQLHNWTTAGAIVEWAPMTRIKDLAAKNAQEHVEEILTSGYEFLLTMGAVCLNSFANLPTMQDFIGKLGIKTPEIAAILKSYERQEYNGDAVKALRKHPPGETFLEWLQKKEASLI